MKSLTQTFILALSLAQIAISVHAQDKTDPYKKTDIKAPAAEASQAPTSPMIQVTTEWIELKSEDAMPLLRDGLAPNSTELIQKIRDLEKQGKAVLIDTCSCVTRSGQRTITDSSKEYIYPADYKAADAPSQKTPNLPGDPTKDKEKDGNAVTTTETGSTPLPQNLTMRLLGARMEVEPIIDPSGTFIDLNLAPEFTALAGTVAHGLVRLGGANVAAVEQPLFVSSKVTTTLTLRSGHTIVAAAQTPHDAAGNLDPTKKWFILVHASLFQAN